MEGIYKFKCPRCGFYAIKMSNLEIFKRNMTKLSEKQQFISSNYVHHNYQFPYIIKEPDIELFKTFPDKAPLEKLDYLLLALCNKANSFEITNVSNYDNLFLEAESWICSKNEFLNSLKMLKKDGYIDYTIFIDDTLGHYTLNSTAFNRSVYLNDRNSTISLKEKTFAEIDENYKTNSAKITVLFMATNPLDTQHLKLDEEARSIQKHIRLAEYRDSLIFESRWATRSSDILQVINETKPTIVHFSGHGSQSGNLLFQNHSGNNMLVSIEAITKAMATASDTIRLVVFNSCFSEL
jgi:hypothetical protein